MGHFVTGIIAKSTDAPLAAAQLPFKQFCDLERGYVIFPLTDDLIDSSISSPQTYCFEQFTYLSLELWELLCAASNTADLTYLETEYFGGEGCQSAVVFRNGKVAFGPAQGHSGAINQALEFVGVPIVQGEFDAFQSIGLGGFRSSDALLESL